MAQRPGFDMSRLSTASKILLGGGLLLLIAMFLPWNQVCVDLGAFGGRQCAGSVGGWSGVGVIAGLFLILLLAWEGMQAAGVRTGINVAPTMISAALAAGVVLFVIIRIFQALTGISYGAFLGIIAALAIGYGGFMKFQEGKAAGPLPPPPPPGTPPPPPPTGGFSA